MKLTKSKLKQLIKEELKINLYEDAPTMVELVSQIGILVDEIAKLKPDLKTAIQEFKKKLETETEDEVVASVISTEF